MLIVRSKHRWCCCPQKYYAEAIPRFKILNVTFTNGHRRQWRWVLLLLILGIFLMVIGILVLPPKCTPSSYVYFYDEPKGAAVALIIFGVVMIVTSPVPLFFTRNSVSLPSMSRASEVTDGSFLPRRTHLVSSNPNDQTKLSSLITSLSHYAKTLLLFTHSLIFMKFLSHIVF